MAFEQFDGDDVCVNGPTGEMDYEPAGRKPALYYGAANAQHDEEPLEPPGLNQLFDLEAEADEADYEEEEYAANSGGEAPLPMPTLDDLFGT